MPSAHHGHSHAHEHDAAGAPLGDGRLVLAVGVNLLLTVGQIAGGLLAGSLALLADALHNLNDAGSLALALVARRIARRPTDERRTFGYRRAQVVGALINLTALSMIGLYLVYEAVMRFLDPSPVAGWLVIAVGGVALVIDLATVMLTHPLSGTSMNIRAAFIHNVADALGSVAVVFVGVLILVFGFELADPIATLLIAAYVLYQALGAMPQAVRILMASTPAGLRVEEVADAMEAVDGVRSVHHLHAWQLDEHHRALEAHVVIDRIDAERMEGIKHELKRRLAEAFAIDHTTLEFEFYPPGFEGCEDTSRIARSRAGH